MQIKRNGAWSRLTLVAVLHMHVTWSYALIVPPWRIGDWTSVQDLNNERKWCRCNETAISLKAGCQLFLRYITRTSALEMENFEAAKARIIEVSSTCQVLGLEYHTRLSYPPSHQSPLLCGISA